MALTYLPNANEVRDSSGSSPLPWIAVGIVVVALIGSLWVLHGSSGSGVATTVTTVTVPAPVRPVKPTVATYGTPGEYFKVAFGATPDAAADTGGLVSNFPAHSSVSGYAVTGDPLAVYQLNDVVPTAPTLAVLTATLPKSSGATKYLAAFKSEKFLKPVRVDGFAGYSYVGPVNSAINSGVTNLDGRAQEDVLFLARGQRAYTVAAITQDAGAAKAFVASFHPVNDSAVPVPITGAR